MCGTHECEHMEHMNVNTFILEICMTMSYVITECKHTNCDHLMCRVVRSESNLQLDKDTPREEQVGD
jgi:hypothetical protein